MKELTIAQEYALYQRDYFSSFVVKRSRRLVEEILGQHLSLGERMILSDFARDSLSRLLNIADGVTHEWNTFEAFEEAAFRFMKTYYPQRLGKDKESKKLKINY